MALSFEDSLKNSTATTTEDGGKTEDGKKITIVTLTEAGLNFVPSEDED